jgi:hypothetical protein
MNPDQIALIRQARIIATLEDQIVGQAAELQAAQARVAELEHDLSLARAWNDETVDERSIGA